MLNGQRAEVVVVGGGIIGLTVAWRLARRGIAVVLLERGATGEGTSRVAAGMLAPVAEVEFGEAGRRVLELGLRSAASWPGFTAELREDSGAEFELLRTGTLLLARDEDEARELERQLAFRRSLGLGVERLLASQAREREPALAPTVRLALEVSGDHAVDPRPVLAALRRACLARGARLREQAHVASVELDAARERVAGVRLADGERIDADRIVLAAGAWTDGLGGLPANARVPVRPVKGQILRLRDPAGPGLLRRVVRFEGGYVLPRGDGRYVLGATVEERGFELRATAGGVYELLRDARELIPGVSELEIEELSVGLRPGTPDNAPAIGHGAVAGLMWATGHHRNGILLAPLTGELIAGLLDPSAGDAPADPLLAACDPLRFAQPGVTPGAVMPGAAMSGTAMPGPAMPGAPMSGTVKSGAATSGAPTSGAATRGALGAVASGAGARS
jgi:glycine oxidase